MAKKEASGIIRQGTETESIFDNKYFFVGVGFASLVVAVLILYLIDFIPGLSHVNIRVLSGSTTGNYYHTAERVAEIAGKKRGKVLNIATNGSIDNIKRLHASKERGIFALVQNGMPWADGLELIAHLKSPETVFFLGAKADAIRSLSDIRNMRIGVGPEGSGTAYLGERIFAAPQMKALNVRLSHHASDEQLKLLKRGELDLGVFVISEKSSFIEKAICEDGMQIAAFKQSESITLRLPYLWIDYIREGVFDPVRNLPSSDKKVLKVDTLIVGNGRARRSQVIGLLSVFSEIYPHLINYNRTVTNYTGLVQNAASRDFFNNQGPEILDLYAPRLMDFIPLSNLVQLVMVVSIFFNLMGMGNRFYLWRIDANRVAIEERIKEFFNTAPLPLPEEIDRMTPQDEHRTEPGLGRLNAIIARLEEVVSRCRKQSQSMLVPMGAEMAYRYQEELISKNLMALKVYRSKIGKG